jgi:hypothetical protein
LSGEPVLDTELAAFAEAKGLVSGASSVHAPDGDGEPGHRAAVQAPAERCVN